MGTGRRPAVDARGTPLGVALSGTIGTTAGCSRAGRGAACRRPGAQARRRRECRRRGIQPRIARRGVESSQRLGRHRWVVERTLAWLARFRRLIMRYERRADIHLALSLLACAVICLQQIRRSCP